MRSTIARDRSCRGARRNREEALRVIEMRIERE
jgi:hypothetical protein